jgi:hypothetical protein
MVSLIRHGPRILLFKSSQPEALIHYLSDAFGAVSCDIDTAFEKATEYSTIIYITDEIKGTVQVNYDRNVVIIDEAPDTLLCKIFNCSKRHLIEAVRTAPNILIMRASGNLEKVLHQIQTDFGGTVGTYKEILDSGNDNSTLVALTEKPLNHSVGLNDCHPLFLQLNGNHFEHFKQLRMHGLHYLNVGIDNKDWFEIEIRIYDMYSAYKLHYDRLVEVIEGLELGIVLGESWSKDYPRRFMTVVVYRMRFFTFKEPTLIKNLLLGMEYLSDGTRVVDYDVYYRHKKLYWTDQRGKKDPQSRHLYSLKYRDEIFSRLSQDSIEKITQIEEEIIKSRTTSKI